MSRLRSKLSSRWRRHTQPSTETQLADLQLWIEFLNKAHRGISINLLTYRKPDVTCWSDASFTGMGGYNSLGHAWWFELPLECRGRFTLYCLEYVSSIITISLYLMSSPSTEFPCILSLLDSTSAIGWLHSSSFADASQATHVSLARYLASMMLDNNAILYSQHIKGSQHIIADTLSRDFHIDSNELSSLIISTFQVPTCFNIFPLES